MWCAFEVQFISTRGNYTITDVLGHREFIKRACTPARCTPHIKRPLFNDSNRCSKWDRRDLNAGQLGLQPSALPV